jgi:hypothetical protein
MAKAGPLLLTREELRAALLDPLTDNAGLATEKAELLNQVGPDQTIVVDLRI